LLHLRLAEPRAEHVDAERLSPDRFADVFRLAYADTTEAPTSWPSQVDTEGDESGDQSDPEPAFDDVPSESWQTDLVSEDQFAEDMVPEVPDDLVRQDVVREVRDDLVGRDVVPEVPSNLVGQGVVLEVPEDLVSGDLTPEDLEDIIPGIPEDVDAVDVVPEVPEILVPQIGRHRRPTFLERVALHSPRRV